MLLCKFRKLWSQASRQCCWGTGRLEELVTNSSADKLLFSMQIDCEFIQSSKPCFILSGEGKEFLVESCWMEVIYIPNPIFSSRAFPSVDCSSTNRQRQWAGFRCSSSFNTSCDTICKTLRSTPAWKSGTNFRSWSNSDNRVTHKTKSCPEEIFKRKC